VLASAILREEERRRKRERERERERERDEEKNVRSSHSSTVSELHERGPLSIG